MATLEIKKQTEGYFRFILDGDVLTSVIDNAPNLTSQGNTLNFKTKNGANIIKKQFISYSDLTYYDDTDTPFTFGSIDAVWIKLISEGFFDGLGNAGGGVGVDRFDNLLDTFSYVGNDGKVPVVDQSQLKLVPTVFYNFKDFIQLEDVAITNLIENKILSVQLVAGVPKIVLSDPPAEPEQLFNTIGRFTISDESTTITPLAYTTGDLLLTNDNLGLLANSSFAPFGLSSVFNTSTNKFVFDELSVGDEVTMAVKIKVTTTSTDQEINLKLIAGEGSLEEIEYLISSKVLTSIAEHQIYGFVKIPIDSEAIRVNPAKLMFNSSDTASIEVVTFEPTIIRKGVNVLDVEFDGTDYVKKDYALNYSYSTGTTNAVFPLRANGGSVYTLTNPSLLSVSGFDLSLIVGDAEIPYTGKTIRLLNQTGNIITINHYDDTNAEIPLYLKDGQNISMPQNEIIEFSYSGSELTETFKSWGNEPDNTITREKFTFVASQDFTLSNVPNNVVYVTVNGQVLDITQYDITSDVLTINDTLDSGDIVTIVYQLNASVFFGNNVQLKKDNLVFVDKPDDLPNPILGVRTFADNTAYYFTKSVDLLGDRLVCGQNTVILASSSENVILSSTGLTGTALITSNYSLPIRHITITADVALDLDGDGSTTALDWLGVNFNSCNTVGTIKDYTNHVWTDCAFLESGNLTYDGTIGSIAINSSLFNSASGQTAFIIPATCTISRRLRFNLCAFVIGSGETGINVSTSASIPNESYIIRVCNFSGGGTYTSGVLYTDNKAQFKENVGLSNSNEISQYYMNGNETTTTIASTATPVKVSGTTTSASVTQRFTNTNNRATYIGSVTRVFEIRTTMSLTSGNNHQIGSYIAKNGTVLNESKMNVTTNGSGKAENVVVQTLVSMNTNDYLEVFVENNTLATDITVSNLNTIIR